MKILARRPREV